MGLDTTHEAWHGAYGAFMRWRQMICEVAGLPPLSIMEGFYQANSPLNDPLWAIKGLNETERHLSESLQKQLPIKWTCLKPSPLHELLNHSDCEGLIPWESCGPIADELEKLIPKFPDGEGGGHIGNWRDKTSKFIDGLRMAHAAKENLEFH